MKALLSAKAYVLFKHFSTKSSGFLQIRFDHYFFYFQILQYDMWNVTPTNLWDWSALKAKIAEHGVRNSLLLAPMPTASTAQILGNNESIEPYTSNIYSRRVLSGEFQIVNPHLLKDLTERGLWDEDMKNEIIANNGSVQVFLARNNVLFIFLCVD